MWQGAQHLTEVVLDLYDASLRESTRNTYRVGQRAYDRFIATLDHGVRFPFLRNRISETELNLAFYIAYLLLRPTITSAKTVLGYETHVKSSFIEEGCGESIYKTPFLRKIRRGVRNTLPERADKRGALLLPLLTISMRSNRVDSNEYSLLHFATVIGFLGMLRPHTFAQLRPASLTLVTYAGKCIPMPNLKRSFMRVLDRSRRTARILGFVLDFQSKTRLNARAYLPSLSSVRLNSAIVSMCPMCALINITAKGLVTGMFLKKISRRKLLIDHLKMITGSSSTVAPYALRIGGRTWKLSNGMDRQLVDFLRTWKCSDASARYFRGNPRAILLMVRKFYLTKDPSREPLRGNATG